MRIHQTWRGPLVCLALYALLLMALVYSCGHFPEANGQTFAMPGDTIRVVGVARDSQGVAVVPDAARLFVMRDGSIVDSTKYYPGGGLTVISNWNKALQGIYIVSGAGTLPIDLQFLMRYNWEGFLGDQADVTPSLVRINPKIKTVDRTTLNDLTTLTTTTTFVTEEITATIGVIDTLAPSAREDFYQGDGLATMSCVDTVLAGGIYYQGEPADNADVWLVNESPWVNRWNVRWSGSTSTATPGYFSAMVYVPSLPCTLYVWAHDGVRWLEQGTRLIITAREDCD